MQTADKLNKAVSTWQRKDSHSAKDFKAKVTIEALREESTIQEIAGAIKAAIPHKES